MPNFLKKAARQTRRVCGEDEVPVSALFSRPRHGEEIKRLGAPGGALAKVAKFADVVDASEGTAGDQRVDMFGQNAILILTDRRLLAFAHGTYSGMVKGLIGEVPLTSIRAMSLDAPEPGKHGPALLQIAFVDGETFAVTPGSRRRRFVAAFEDIAQLA
jgi:hypothetical protein